MLCTSIGVHLENNLRQLVAGAAPARLGLARKVDGGETVGELVINSPWGVVGTSVSSSSVASGLDARVGQGVVVLIASLDGLIDGGLAGPCT